MVQSGGIVFVLYCTCTTFGSAQVGEGGIFLGASKNRAKFDGKEVGKKCSCSKYVYGSNGCG
jgi:hypothetical protein